jgi:hypothetical protein
VVSRSAGSERNDSILRKDVMRIAEFGLKIWRAPSPSAKVEASLTKKSNHRGTETQSCQRAARRPARPAVAAATRRRAARCCHIATARQSPSRDVIADEARSVSVSLSLCG